jgi:hypothetical protein
VQQSKNNEAHQRESIAEHQGSDKAPPKLPIVTLADRPPVPGDVITLTSFVKRGSLANAPRWKVSRVNLHPDRDGVWYFRSGNERHPIDKYHCYWPETAMATDSEPLPILRIPVQEYGLRTQEIGGRGCYRELLDAVDAGKSIAMGQNLSTFFLYRHASGYFTPVQLTEDTKQLTRRGFFPVDEFRKNGLNRFESMGIGGGVGAAAYPTSDLISEIDWQGKGRTK